MLFSTKVHRNLFPNLAVRGLTQTRHLGSIFYEKTRKNGFYGMLCVEYSTVVEYSTGPEISEDLNFSVECSKIVSSSLIRK